MMTAADFPIENLPYGVFRREGASARIGVAIGDEILDLRTVSGAGLLDELPEATREACTMDTLNALMALTPVHWRALRGRLKQLVTTVPEHMVAMLEVTMLLPVSIGDYTDFYSSLYHARNVGSLFRPDNPLLPNYKWVPIAYHGRASSVRVSGFGVHRPLGQLMPPGALQPTLGPSRRLDYEVELGVYVGRGNELGSRVPLPEAEAHLFGLCLLNDWSARDIQAWEYQPLGPFLAKNFATTVSPWVVTLEALAPFRVPWMRPPQEPAPLAYLDDAATRRAGAFDIQLEAWIDSARMRAAAVPPLRLSHATFRDSWWTLGQMLAHHTVGGCNLCAGDLIGSGTQSGAGPGEAGSLLELTGGGQRALQLPDGESRTFLEDGDRVTLRGWCERPGYRRIGFGEASGTVLAPAAA